MSHFYLPVYIIKLFIVFLAFPPNYQFLLRLKLKLCTKYFIFFLNNYFFMFFISGEMTSTHCITI